MPDHLHLLVSLTGELPLGRIVARLKSKTRRSLAANNVRWQGNYYEHRLREGDALETVLRYCFLNPYRAGLIKPDQIYPHFWMHDEEARWFRPTLDEGHPFPGWLA